MRVRSFTTVAVAAVGFGAALVAAGAGVGAAIEVGAEPAGSDAAGSRARAEALVDRAIDLMGGDEALRGVQRVRLDMMTQWQSGSFRDLAGSDRPSFEPHMDVRDYSLPAWRNTRDFGTRRIVNVVRDSVALTDLGRGFQPLSVAYVDEREELFTYTPDRLVLKTRDAPDLALAGDTLVAGERFHTVRATLLGTEPATVLFHAGTSLPAMLRFRAGHPNDFGLVPWGVMDVEVWYSGWRSFGGLSIPTQWDVSRVGRPYKRLTVRAADFTADFAAADSFPTPEEPRRAYLATRAPMHDRAIDSVAMPLPGLAQVHGFGFPSGAVDIGDGWLLLGAGHAPLNLERGRAALATLGVQAYAGALLATTRAGNGGVGALVEEGVPVFVAPASEPGALAMLAGAGVPARGVDVVAEGRWLGRGERRVRLEPLDLPDAPGSLVVYAPALEWLYVPDATTALDMRIAREHARARGWTVRHEGSGRGVLTVPPMG